MFAVGFDCETEYCLMRVSGSHTNHNDEGSIAFFSPSAPTS